MKFSLATRCVEQKDPQPLFDMYETAREVTFATFARRTDWKTVAKWLGYAVGSERGLHLRKDYTVSFYRAKWFGQVCYYMDWSRIDHIFLKQGLDSGTLMETATQS